MSSSSSPSLLLSSTVHTIGVSVALTRSARPVMHPKQEQPQLAASQNRQKSESTSAGQLHPTPKLHRHLGSTGRACALKEIAAVKSSVGILHGASYLAGFWAAKNAAIRAICSSV